MALLQELELSEKKNNETLAGQPKSGELLYKVGREEQKQQIQDPGLFVEFSGKILGD